MVGGSALSATVAAGLAGCTEGDTNLPETAPDTTKNAEISGDFDYIIIGGGTAGPVLASRLTESSNVSVLVLEAGPENTIEGGKFAAGVGQMWGPTTNWGFNSASQAGLAGREIMQPRGKVIGGCAAINVGSWSRGTKENYESWDLPGWDWEMILETYKSIETSPGNNPTFRGLSGPMRLEDTPAGSEMTEVFRNAAIEAGVGVTEDRNGEKATGYDLWETIFPDGSRWNTEQGYLDEARKRPNLTVETEAYVTRINFDDKRANSVSYVQNGETVEVVAGREILLCAGAINSPHILMLSGIGPADQLKQHGIDVVVDSPGVGENLADHLRTQFGALTPEGIGETVNPDPSDPDQLEQWRSGNYGPLTVAENTAAAFIYSDERVPHPDIELMYAINPEMGVRSANPDRAGWYIMVGLVQPKSRGAVRLNSADPMEKAIYDPAYLTHPDDMTAYIKGFRVALSHVNTEALGAYTDPGTLSLSFDASDEEIEDHIRQTAESIYHPVGTVRMGRNDDIDAPLDTQCRVKGVEGLRVVDASSIPSLISGHTMAPTIMIAERVAGFIAAG